jgi:hypothetical protein
MTIILVAPAMKNAPAKAGAFSLNRDSVDGA